MSGFNTKKSKPISNSSQNAADDDCCEANQASPYYLGAGDYPTHKFFSIFPHIFTHIGYSLYLPRPFSS